MIPDIGIMIGAYILTRMVEMVTSDAHWFARFLAVITIVITLISVVDLLAKSAANFPQ